MERRNFLSHYANSYSSACYNIPATGSDLITMGDSFICPATYLRLRKDGTEPKRSKR
ncbi:MAG: hypothetical protein QMD71_09550 [bacterium]|nr:hypothetical protein [bacterium]